MLCKDQIKLLEVLAASDTYNPYNLAVPKQYQNIWHLYTGCVIIIDAFLVCSPARIVIGSQAVDGYRRDPRRPGHMVGEE